MPKARKSLESRHESDNLKDYPQIVIHPPECDNYSNSMPNIHAASTEYARPMLKISREVAIGRFNVSCPDLADDDDKSFESCRNYSETDDLFEMSDEDIASPPSKTHFEEFVNTRKYPGDLRLQKNEDKFNRHPKLSSRQSFHGMPSVKTTFGQSFSTKSIDIPQGSSREFSDYYSCEASGYFDETLWHKHNETPSELLKRQLKFKHSNSMHNLIKRQDSVFSPPTDDAFCPYHTIHAPNSSRNRLEHDYKHHRFSPSPPYHADCRRDRFFDHAHRENPSFDSSPAFGHVHHHHHHHQGRLHHAEVRQVYKCCCGKPWCLAVVPIEQYLESYFVKTVRLNDGHFILSCWFGRPRMLTVSALSIYGFRLPSHSVVRL